MRPVSRPAPIYRFIGLLSGPLVYGLFRLKARGHERIPGTGFVLAANHVSNLDPWALGLPLFPKRWLRFMAKSELYWWPARLVLDAAGAFKVRRGEQDTAAIDTAVELVRSGEIVMMFPEGTRRRKGLRKKTWIFKLPVERSFFPPDNASARSLFRFCARPQRSPKRSRCK